MLFISFVYFIKYISLSNVASLPVQFVNLIVCLTLPHLNFELIFLFHIIGWKMLLYSSYIVNHNSLLLCLVFLKKNELLKSSFFYKNVFQFCLLHCLILFYFILFIWCFVYHSEQNNCFCKPVSITVLSKY